MGNLLGVESLKSLRLSRVSGTGPCAAQCTEWRRVLCERPCWDEGVGKINRNLKHFVGFYVLAIHPDWYLMQTPETIKLFIEGRACPIHDIHPNLEIIGHEIILACCCKSFHEDCAEQIASTFLLNPLNHYLIREL